MNKHSFLLFLLFTGFSLTDTIAQSEKIENSLFWEISGKDITRPSYLFGTYHVLNDGYLNEIPSVKKAFEAADGVTVETVLDSSKIQQLLFGLMMSTKKLSELTAADDYKKIGAEVSTIMSVDISMLDQFKPVFITFSLTLAYNQQENKEFLSKFKGVPLDIYFAVAAKKSKKPVASFESMEEQFSILFKHDSEEEQAKQLVEFINTKGNMRGAMKELTDLYVNQDLSGMQDTYKKYTKQFGEASYLLDDRNVKWIKEFPAMLAQGNRFIAVGALHFTGENGLIKLLRGAGYTVRALPIK